MTDLRATPYLARPLTAAELRLARHRIAAALGEAARAIARARKECNAAGIVIDIPSGRPLLDAVAQLADLTSRKART